MLIVEGRAVSATAHLATGIRKFQIRTAVCRQMLKVDGIGFAQR